DVVLSGGGKGICIAADAARAAGAMLAVAGPAPDVKYRALHVGMLPPSEMHRLYAAPDCLVHTPHQDYWPHAINEALAAGLPVVATPDTGVPREVFAGPGCAVVERRLDSLSRAIRHALQVGE